MYKNFEVVTNTMKRCSDEKDLSSCDNCAYRKWSKEYYGDYSCKRYLMKDALELLSNKEEEIKKISRTDSKDVVEFFRTLVKGNKHQLFEAGLNGGEIYTWSTGRSTPKLAKFIAVIRACGYDIKIVRCENE